MAPQIITRRGWGAAPPRGSIYTRRSTTAVVVHHTTGKTLGKDRLDDWLRNIQAYHFSKGWSDLGYCDVFVDGMVYDGRGTDKIGAHARGHNATTYGIAYLGDSKYGISDETKETLYWLWKERGRGKPIYGHREMSGASTACPGDPLQAFVRELRAGWRPEEAAPVARKYYLVEGVVPSNKMGDVRRELRRFAQPFFHAREGTYLVLVHCDRDSLPEVKSYLRSVSPWPEGVIEYGAAEDWRVYLNNPYKDGPLE